MSRRNRSKNPDLLFPDIMEERIKRIRNLWHWPVGSLKDVDRMTVFVTHRCNLFCRYCNGPHVSLQQGNSFRKRIMLHSDLSLKSFRQMLFEALAIARIRHIHFTGGEPTLNPDLPRFIELSSNHDIPASITTNGVASPELYEELINKGLTEIRVSLDSCSIEDFDGITGVQGSFDRVVESIRRIVKLRDEGKDIFLVINACVDNGNHERLEDTLDFLLNLDADDIKFLTVAEDKEEVCKGADPTLIDRLNRHIKHIHEGKFPLLRTKIQNLLNPIASGLQDLQAQILMKHCFIPLTERTFDATHYYPCSIYVRYYGEPLGRITDSFSQQQETTSWLSALRTRREATTTCF